MSKRLVFFVVVAVSVQGAGPALGTEAVSVDFNREVRPILDDHCLACHGQNSKARKGELRLDVREEAVADGAIVPGKSAESELIVRLHSSDPEEVMPPPDSTKGKAMTAAEVALLTR